MPIWMLLANLSTDDRGWVLDQLEDAGVDLEDVAGDPA